MPQDLYAQDPRVLVALGAVRTLEAGVSPARPPNVTSRVPAVALGAARPVELSAMGISFVLDLPWDLADPLTEAQADFSRLDPPDAVTFALRDWLTGHGYLEPSPEAS